LIIREMQNKLATWSSEDKDRRFDRLLRMIANRSWLLEAARITLASRGARTPGIDGIDKQALESDLQNQLEIMRAELLDGRYKPQPARRIYILKPNGKQRPLGIPTLKDRIVQRAMLMANEFGGIELEIIPLGLVTGDLDSLWQRLKLIGLEHLKPEDTNNIDIISTFSRSNLPSQIS